MSRLTRISAIPPRPARPSDGHKGTFGTVIVVGGSATMIGAPALCATAALRSGAGLVKIATLPAVLPLALIVEPCATGIALGANLSKLDRADPQGQAVLAVGPGLGRSRRAGAWVMLALRDRRRLVLDADGLNLLASSRRRAEHQSDLVLTPHPGEFARLAKPLGIISDGVLPGQRPADAAALALAHRAVVVLKGHATVVSDGRRCYVNTTGNPALATPGSGDVLTGLIAALMAQGMSGFDAAVLGVCAHGRAGDRWARRHGPSGLTARDLADLLPDALAGTTRPLTR